jgi:hypothetical protein
MNDGLNATVVLQDNETTTKPPTTAEGGIGNDATDAATLVLVVFLIGFCMIICLMALLRQSATDQHDQQVESKQTQKKRIAERKEYIASNMMVREWKSAAISDDSMTSASDDLTLEYGDETDNVPTGLRPSSTSGDSVNRKEQLENSDSHSRIKGDDFPSYRECTPTAALSDYDSFCEDTGCAICLSNYEPCDRVCESVSCKHIFHEACMSAWLIKHDRCPICREPYLVETA